MNSYSLIAYLKSMNSEIFKSPNLLISAALNVNSSNFEVELNRGKRKIEEGARVFFTQPVFSTQSISNLVKATKTLDARIIAGILPVASYKNALFLNNEVPGISIPDEFLQALVNRSEKEVNSLAVEFCMNIVEKTFNYCDGYCLMTPLRNIEPICELALRISKKLEKMKY